MSLQNTREVDRGVHERLIEDKIADVERPLERGDAIIVFAVEAQTTNIVPARGAFA